MECKDYDIACKCITNICLMYRARETLVNNINGPSEHIMLIMHVVMDINACCDRYKLTLFDVDAILFCERKVQWSTQVCLFKACLSVLHETRTVSILRIANLNSLFY